jgi:tripartite-type tricarboxylate transporter receptor subunit TctC
MLLHRRRFLSALGSTVVAAVGHRSAWSQAAPYPSRPVRLIIPFAPGGPNDLAGRLIAQGLSDRLGARFYVENIAGSGGNIGTAQAARAAADGYTVLLVSPSYAANPSLFDKVAYDPARSFDAVTMAVTAPTVLTVHPSIEAQSVAQLIALIRANPAKFSYASPGTGTPPHLLGELFRLSLGLDLVHVPFSSGGTAIGSTVAGHTPISFGALPPAVPHIKDGKLRAIAFTSNTGSQVLPGVPTMADAGYPEIVADIWSAILVPAGTPRNVVTLLHAEISKVIRLPKIQERMASLGYEPVGNAPDECAAQIGAEMLKWAKVIKEAGIRA